MTSSLNLGGNDITCNSLSVGASSFGASATTIASAELSVLATATNANSGTGKAVITGTSGALTVAGALTASSTVAVTGALTPTGGVAAGGGFAVSPRNCHTGGTSAQVSTDFTDQTPVITEVYFAEVFIPANVSVTGVSLFRGSVSSGNYKVGLANSSGVVVATSASTASSGTDSYVDVAFTAPYSAIGPATYYVLALYDNTTVRANTHTLGRFVAGKQTGQVYATGFTTITPGTSFTTALGPVATLY